MSVSPIPNGEQFFVDENGKPYAGGQVLMAVPGTLALKHTFSDQDGAVPNLNPVPLDAAGRCVMWGSGDYRQILYDNLGNEIWDRLTSCALPGDVISAVMLPVVGAQSLQQARDLLGVTQAIQDAVSDLSLLKGPTGPQGPQGVKGPTGATGPAATGSSNPTASSGNPGYWFDPNTNFLINFGISATNGSGTAVLGFAKNYTNLLGVVVTPKDNSLNTVLRVVNAVATGFSVIAEDTDNTIGIATGFSWCAHGFGTP